MFRYSLYNKKEYTKDIIVSGERPEDWINPKDMNGIIISAWEEHCLECSPPACYRNCSMWMERSDKKCRKTYYGLKKRNDIKKLYPGATQLKFRPWAKIETHIGNKGIPYSKYNRMLSMNYIADVTFYGLACLLSPIFPTLKPCGFEEYLKNKMIFYAGKTLYPTHFLIQLYSEEKDNYKIQVEMRDPNLFFRTSFDVKQGFNQKLIALDVNVIMEKKDIKISIFPENNYEKEVVILFCDFILYKHKKTMNSPAGKVKCIAWDLDNTLWEGILTESDAESLQLRDGVEETLKTMDERGIIHTIVSKNNIDEVIPVLKRLGVYDYFVYIIANWNQKSKNIELLAKELNIGIDTFAFVDDSSFERGDIEENLTCVRTYTEKEIEGLKNREEFQVVVTNDSRNRRLMYQADIKRKELHNDYTGTDIDFIKSCEMSITIEKTNENNFIRSYELINRTNQLNLSGTKYQEDEFRKLIDDNKDNSFVVYSKDKYGDYGQVGFFIVKFVDNKKDAIVSEYAMSCRVAEKWIEPAILSWLKSNYDADKIKLYGKQTQKNERLVKTFEKFGMHSKSNDDDRIELVIESSNISFPEVVKLFDNTR